MLLGSVAIFFVQVSPNVQAIFQMFSAGLLISAVANELFPLMQGEKDGKPHENKSYGAYLALTGGILTGLIFMYGLKMIFDEEEEEEDDEEEVQDQEANPNTPHELEQEVQKDLSRNLLEKTPRSPKRGGWFSNKNLRQNVPYTAFQEDSARLEEAIQELYDVMNRTQHGGGGTKRNMFDEALHVLMGRLDTARRHIFKVKRFSEHDQARIRFHLDELQANMRNVKEQSSLEGVAAALDVFEATVDHIHHHAEGKKRPRRWAPLKEQPESEEKQEILSVSEVAAVTVDAMVDGLLIGLSYIASHEAGLSMAIATSIEMGFLGVSFSNNVSATTKSWLKHLGIVAIPPIALVAMGVVGDILGQELIKQELLFIGFIAFAAVALLFLVTEELLTEANEVSQGAFGINVCFFLGLYAGIVMDKALG